MQNNGNTMKFCSQLRLGCMLTVCSANIPVKCAYLASPTLSLPSPFLVIIPLFAAPPQSTALAFPRTIQRQCCCNKIPPNTNYGSCRCVTKSVIQLAVLCAEENHNSEQHKINRNADECYICIIQRMLVAFRVSAMSTRGFGFACTTRIQICR